ncbi:helix-turn-helix domain-containing protein [Curvibacter sp. HBC61]|uniref:Helix-turn-helix domain-containing protein n=1 Tax=Curvibacter cyanobacteriorum TaxID=3026422 RepID=A0ABT5N542_9BURK|nr:helix-turn-helix domain-containing protein [Curvibacter sp. HBC61]MDD0840776.1 helix-turn-helix domain-containing protein [Curvibacter sp. HBC61]
MHTATPSPAHDERQALIRQARAVWLDEAATGPAAPALGGATAALEPWITRSWQRCLAAGRQPSDKIDFDPLHATRQRQVREDNQALIDAARPVLAQLTRTIAGTRYFSLLTNAQGVVVEVQGPVEARSPAAPLARVGVDLSERAVGTTAIGAALTELQPVWLHQGEHFFHENRIYSCAGAPVFGPEGDCVGMLDLTGVEVPERPELRHLAARAARHIEDALTLQRPWQLLLRLNWPGTPMVDGAPNESDGLLCLDADGLVLGSNGAARQMLPQPLRPTGQRLHASDLFALPWGLLFDHAQREAPAQDLPLWSGLRVQTLARLRQHHAPSAPAAPPPATLPGAHGLKDLEAKLIRQAVDDARGNVAEAAQRLGISRATVYRKLATRGGPAR